ncbi:hypothetical protein, partial [Vineibacter terrae]|uniref:hypothetical protein n=1 Tax=Vineibacter terrae TaxID=2586908 RepID=UPI002E35EE04
PLGVRQDATAGAPAGTSSTGAASPAADARSGAAGTAGDDVLSIGLPGPTIAPPAALPDTAAPDTREASA